MEISEQVGYTQTTYSVAVALSAAYLKCTENEIYDAIKNISIKVFYQPVSKSKYVNLPGDTEVRYLEKTSRQPALFCYIDSASSVFGVELTRQNFREQDAATREWKDKSVIRARLMKTQQLFYVQKAGKYSTSLGHAVPKK